MLTYKVRISSNNESELVGPFKAFEARNLCRMFFNSKDIHVSMIESDVTRLGFRPHTLCYSSGCLVGAVPVNQDTSTKVARIMQLAQIMDQGINGSLSYVPKRWNKMGDIISLHLFRADDHCKKIQHRLLRNSSVNISFSKLLSI